MLPANATMASVQVASKNDTIRLNMEAFLPYICSCIQLTDLLTQIHDFTKEQRKELFNISKENNTEACKQALHLFVNEFHEPGRFIAFKEAMATRRYPVIVKLLEGEHIPFNENCQKVIHLFTTTLDLNLNPEEILPYLESQGTLQANDAEEVRAEAMNHGRQRARWLLLFHLPNRVDNWFRNFMEALIDTRYNEVAQRMEPDMYEKIMTQRHSILNLNHSDSAHASEIAIQNGLEGSTIEKEEFEVGEKYSMSLCAAPAPESISSNGSMITRGDHCNDYIDGKLIQYDRNFLLSLRDSPLSNTCSYWKEIEKFKDIVIPKTLPRKLEATANSRSSSTGKNSIETYVRSADTMPRRVLVSDIEESNKESEILPNNFKGGYVQNSVKLSIANVETVTENYADNLSIGTMDTKSDNNLTNVLNKDIGQNAEGECQAEDQDAAGSLKFDLLLIEDKHLYGNDSGSCLGSLAETLPSDEPEFTVEELFVSFGEEGINHLPEQKNVDFSKELNFDELNVQGEQKISNVSDIEATNYDDEYMECNIKTGIGNARQRRHDPYRDAILQIMADIDQYMNNHPAMATIPKKDEFIKTACRVPPCGGTQQFQQWLSELTKAIEQVRSSDICSLLNPCKEHLEVYNKALMIYADDRRRDADTILEKFMTYQAVIESKVETEVVLMGLYNRLKQEPEKGDETSRDNMATMMTHGKLYL